MTEFLPQSSRVYMPDGIAPTIQASGSRQGNRAPQVVAADPRNGTVGQTVQTLKSNSGSNSGVSTHDPLIIHEAVGFCTKESGKDAQVGTVPTIRAESGDPHMGGRTAVAYLAFDSKKDGHDASEVVPTLRSMNFSDSWLNGGGQVGVVVPIDLRQASRGETVSNERPGGSSGGPPGVGVGDPGDPAYTVSERGQAVAYDEPPPVVRRLTPNECEKCQGMPPGHTLVEFKGKPAADSHRYRAVGNSMAVPCMAWIGRRLLAEHQRLQDA